MAMPIPDKLRKVHLIGVCGIGMSALAVMLKKQGFEVQGSDENPFPPASTLLESAGVKVLHGFKPEHITPDIDLVIVGNVVRITNEEFLAVARSQIPFVSMADALLRLFMRGRKRLVIAGTHGKTTTTAMTAWILDKCGLSPGFFIGGVPKNFGINGRSAPQGAPFVIEGDEYDTALFDKRPKMLVYRPHAVAITAVEYDHADIYPTPNDYWQQFEILVSQIGSDGLLALCADNQELLKLSRKTRARVVLCSTKNKNLKNGLVATDIDDTPTGANFTLWAYGQKISRIKLALSGVHNVQNALLALALAQFAGADILQAANSLAEFSGVKRRLEVRFEINGITVIDDFAHHPTEVAASLEAVRNRFPAKRLIAVFDPRSNTSRRKLYQKRFAEALSKADLIFIKQPEDMWKIPENERINITELISQINQIGKFAKGPLSVEEIVQEIANLAQDGDVIVGLSNGGFGGFYDKLYKTLA